MLTALFVAIVALFSLPLNLFYYTRAFIVAFVVLAMKRMVDKLERYSGNANIEKETPAKPLKTGKNYFFL